MSSTSNAPHWLGQRDTALATDEQTRSFAIAPATLNVDERSVEAILATENPTMVFGPLSANERAEPYLEALLMAGCEIPARMPLLDTHNRSTVANQIGSIRDMRITDGAVRELVGRLIFGSVAEREWAMVREGHVTDVSAGYVRLAKTIIPRGKTQQIMGRSFTAPADMPLVIVTRWRPHEASLTPIGADPAARVRTAAHEPTPATAGSGPDHTLPTRNGTVNRELRNYLESVGLRSDASDAAAWAFFHTLTGDHQTRAAALVGTDTVPAAAEPVDAATRMLPPTPRQQGTTTATFNGQTQSVAINDPQAITLAERARIASIQQLGGRDCPEELMTRAINDGWDEGRFATELLRSTRDSRSPAAGAPAIHSRSHETNCTRSALAAGLMLRQNAVPLDRNWAPHALMCRSRLPDWCLQDVNSAARNQIMDAAWQYRHMSLVDMCREAVRLDGGRVTHDADEMIRSALSGGALSAIFTTNINAELLSAYVDAPDSTVGWVAETDVANFQSTERASMGKFGALTKHARGGEADHLDADATKETSKIARYSGQFILDEQDIIDDRFGALEQVSPAEMGNSCRQLRPDMVYAELLGNDSLDADSVALFHADHANLGSAAFSATALEAAISVMAAQRIRNRPLNVAPRFLLVPHALRFSAQIAISSAQRYSASGNFNPLADLGLSVVPDDRLSAAGVVDPRDGATQTGSATNWFLAARPGENGVKTLVVKYRRGTGRAPQIRSFTLSQGKWGLGWDIAHDIGCDSDDYRGLYKSTGLS